MDIANKVLVGVQSMLSLRKRPADRDEGRLDGQRFAKRRRILNPSTTSSGTRYRPASSSKTTSMPPPLAKELLSSDDEIKDSPTDNPPGRANPLQVSRHDSLHLPASSTLLSPNRLIDTR